MGAAGPGPFAHRPAALVIGTAAVKTVLPEIPPETLAEWQRVVDLTARLARVPASLIMQTERPKHTVLVSSRTEGNPYAVGREYDLNAVLYCQGVFENDGELVVEDATRDHGSGMQGAGWSAIRTPVATGLRGCSIGLFGEGKSEIQVKTRRRRSSTLL